MGEGRTIRAQEVAADIRSGLTDRQLMEKYRLSEKGLQSLVSKLLAAGLLNRDEYDRYVAPTQAKTVNPVSATALLYEVRSGVSNQELLKKYDLSRDKLQRILQRFVEAGHLTREEFAERASSDRSTDGSIAGATKGTHAPEKPSPPDPPIGKRKAVEVDPARQKAEEIGQRAYEAAREAGGSALSALKILATDPMGGQGWAIELLGEIRALSAGIVFITVFVVSTVLLLRTIPSARLGSEVYIKTVLIALVPAVALWVGFMAISILFTTGTSFYKCGFSTGVALVPTAFTFLALFILGTGNIEMVALMAFFGMSITLLLLNSAMLDVLKLSTRQAVLLTPTLILMAAYAAKVIYASLFGPRGW
ncbi:MAG: hypothetical protein V2B18_22570 [Pseudomonadota bacterium]